MKHTVTIPQLLLFVGSLCLTACSDGPSDREVRAVHAAESTFGMTSDPIRKIQKGKPLESAGDLAPIGTRLYPIRLTMSRTEDGKENIYTAEYIYFENQYGEWKRKYRGYVR